MDGEYAARRAFDWIRAQAVEADGGKAWCEGNEPVDYLYKGTAGVLLAAAEATLAGLDVGDLADAAQGRLVHLAHHGRMSNDGLFTGWAGVASALQAWAGVSGDQASLEAADDVRVQIAGRILNDEPDPGRYTDIIFGDAGTLLTLLESADEAVTVAANVLADRLAASAESTADGLQWRAVAGRERLTPNFSHGTAGVAYALGMAGRVGDRPELIDVAVDGARTILTLGDHPTGWAVPVLIPPRPERQSVAFGWCHGPTGTIRLFLLLNEIAPHPQWQYAIDACLQAIEDSRLPERLYPGYWDNVARCCGTAGVGQLLLNRHEATGDERYLTWCDRLAADVLDRALTTPDGVTWSNFEHTATPPDLPPEPGFMQGSVGVASWLARLDAAHQGRIVPPLVPWV
ncbi:MAG: hypothetical protein HOQ45_01360 [Nocardioidaceae bacterium]|nr:hypothetical protein [Nocardioidaceae bacterium]